MDTKNVEDAIRACEAIVRKKLGRKMYFEQYCFDLEKQQTIDSYNVGNQKPWLYDHLKNNPFSGAQFKCEDDDETTYLDMDGTIKMWAYTHAAMKARNPAAHRM